MTVSPPFFLFFLFRRLELLLTVVGTLSLSLSAGWGAELVKGKKKASKKKKTETQNVRALLAELNRVYTYEELKAKPPPKVPSLC
jgi:hypothetical protein